MRTRLDQVTGVDPTLPVRSDCQVDSILRRFRTGEYRRKRRPIGICYARARAIEFSKKDVVCLRVSRLPHGPDRFVELRKEISI